MTCRHRKRWAYVTSSIFLLIGVALFVIEYRRVDALNEEARGRIALLEQSKTEVAQQEQQSWEFILASARSGAPLPFRFDLKSLREPPRRQLLEAAYLAQLQDPRRAFQRSGLQSLHRLLATEDGLQQHADDVVPVLDQLLDRSSTSSTAMFLAKELGPAAKPLVPKLIQQYRLDELVQLSQCIETVQQIDPYYDVKSIILHYVQAHPQEIDTTWQSIRNVFDPLTLIPVYEEARLKARTSAEKVEYDQVLSQLRRHLPARDVEEYVP